MINTRCLVSWSRSLVTLLISLTALAHASAEKSELSLSQVIGHSLKSHPAVEARKFEIYAAESGLSAARGLFGLQLSGDLDLMDDLVTIQST